MDWKSLKPRPLDAIPVAIIIVIAILPLIPGDEEVGGFSIITPYRNYDFEFGIDTTLIVESAVGPMEISIEDGSASVITASCPHKICVKTGEISRPGNSIICAPGRVAIIVNGRRKYDAVTK